MARMSYGLQSSKGVTKAFGIYGSGSKLLTGGPIQGIM